MLGLAPPQPTPVVVSVPAPIASRTKTSSSSNNQSRRRRHYDYMQVPSSLASQQRQPYAWEEQHPNNHNHNASSSSSWCHRPSLMAVLLCITLAFTAGTFLDGDSSSSAAAAESRQSTTEPSHHHHHHHHHKSKQRGHSLPAASERKDNIAEDMYRAYRSLEQEYHAKAFHPDNQNKWKVLNQKEDVQVSLLEHESDPTCPYVRMEAVLPSSVADCWEFLSIPNWHETMPKMDPFYETHDMFTNLTHQGVNLILVRKRTHRILAFGKRDFVFLSVSDQPLEDGTWVSGTVSVETPDVPRQSGYTRAFQDSIAFYKPVLHKETGQEQCHLTIVCRIDMNDSSEEGSGGFMPMWLYVKTIGTTGTKSVLRMRDALVEMKQRKHKEEQQEEVVQQSSAPPTPVSSVTTPPTPSPVIMGGGGASTMEETQNTNNEQRWWNRWRGGGAFVQQTFNSNNKWKPLYEVFTHYPTNKQKAQPIVVSTEATSSTEESTTTTSATTTTTRDNNRNSLWGLPAKISWLQKLQKHSKRSASI